MRVTKFLLLASAASLTLAGPALAQNSGAAGTQTADPAPDDAPQNAAADTSADATTDDGDAIVVVGSQIKGSKITEALPVTVVGSEEIANTAAASGDELFRSIPQMGDVSFNSAYLPNSSNSARGDVGSVNLRNLGVGNTLTLLNGRRVVWHPTSRADDNLVPVLTYNTNAIPVSGVERLEVLRDGAAAIYGSDAVAGVVNTVLRKDFEGGEVSLQYGMAEGTHLHEFNANAILGHNFGDGRGNVTLFVDYTDRSALKAADQDYTRSANKMNLFEGTRFEGSTALDGRSTITPWGSFTATGGAVGIGTRNLTNASGQFHIQPGTNAGCQTGLAGGICIDDGTNTAVADRNLRFDAPYAYNTDVMPAVQRLNLFLTSRYEIADGVELFGEAGYYRAETDSVQSPTGTLSSGPVVIPASNYWNPFGAATLPNGQPNPNRIPGLVRGRIVNGVFTPTGPVPAAGVPITLSSYNFADVGPNLVNVKNEQFRLLGGIRFEAAGFDWESAVVYSEATARDRSDGISATLLQRQLALSTPDAYNPFTGGNLLDPSGADTTFNSQAAIDAIRIETVRRSKTSLAMWDIKGSKADLFSLPAGDVGLAIGGEVRRETQFDDRDARVDGTITFTDAVTGFVNGSDLVGSSPSPDTRGKRTVFAAYGEVAIPIVSPEMNIPLVHRFDLQVAGRFEHYSDVGSVAKPKVAAAWDVIDGIRLRGSYSEGFKAPNLEQINATLVTRSNTRTDYLRCEAQLRQPATLPGGAPNPLHITGFNNCSQGFATTAQRSGNPDLKPETSKSWTVGVVLQPRFLEDSVGRVVFTADYWNIKQKGIVGLFGEGNALINDYWLRTQGSSDPNVIRADPTADDIALFEGTGLTPAGRVLYVKDQYVNLLPQAASGIDFGLSWRTPQTGIGRFNLSVNVAYLKKFFLEPSAPIKALLEAREKGEINAGTNIFEQGDLVRRNGKPKWKWNASLTWDIDDQMQVGGYTQYTGYVEDTGLLDSDGNNWLVDDTLTGNLYVQFKPTDKYRFRIGARNITNKKPPLSSDGYLGSLYNPYGRYWYANVRVGF
ncbi:TonB-dependent receptor [Pseudonocardia sp. TMWB2A]|uniref:TonB-dependent receptor domain-containing protein n=1 Tax=Pseudonocardia sp. TMWB2A TaxID=687430 RepID=UPI00307EE107